MSLAPQSPHGWRRFAARLPWPLSRLSKWPHKAEVVALRLARHAAQWPAQSKLRLTRQARHALTRFMVQGQRLRWPAPAAPPEVSVIIISWNHPHLLLRCLRALQQQTGARVEVVVVDNGSDKATQRFLRRLDGVTLVANTGNEGFLRACNQGALVARGEALLLLNNDAFVRPGAIAAALARLRSATDIGAVGGRLVLPSGLLQEAGCIVWSDGATTGYGRGLEPDDPRVMAPRDVDYCSGAFLLTPRAVWEQLHGLDEVYAPCYFEEVDYCMRLREAGLRVVYEPGAVIDHFEFGSEVEPGTVSKVSARNHETFCARHALTLQRSHLPRAVDNIEAARSRPPSVRLDQS